MFSSSHKITGYTKEGDSGFSKIDDLLISKDDQIFNAIGTTRELSSYIGLAREFAIDKEHPYTDKLTRIQTLLVDIALSVTYFECESKNKQEFSEKNTKEIEEWIQEFSANLVPRERYILPGGGKAAASLHVARNICQRAERLGDFLLTVARFAAKIDKRTESVYSPLGTGKNSEDTKIES
ncbi:hypothetical protein AAG570_000568 [Ranatra chinensis]|uniref:Cobalamin adenosyltransferase-like domain-containing protein n=1 Tax=Ranatra chinensis TaxID=642074 RepID=A0ABD0ZEC5_9HEMI